MTIFAESIHIKYSRRTVFIIICMRKVLIIIYVNQHVLLLHIFLTPFFFFFAIRTTIFQPFNQTFIGDKLILLTLESFFFFSYCNNNVACGTTRSIHYRNQIISPQCDHEHHNTILIYQIFPTINPPLLLTEKKPYISQ